MGDRPDFPTMAEVENAGVEQLARWYRFLPTGDTKEQQRSWIVSPTDLRRLEV